MKQHSHSHSKKNHEHHQQSSQLDAYLAQTYQLSIQLKRYKDDMINLTLEHKDTLEKLNQSLRKQSQMQSTIDKTTNQLKAEKRKYEILEQQFNSIQANYKALFDKLYTQKVTTLNDVLLRESEMIIQLSDLKTQNFKNGANFYQQIINTKNVNLKALIEENQKLNAKIVLNSEINRVQLDKLQEENLLLKSKLIKFQKLKALIQATNIKNGDAYKKQEYELVFEHVRSKMQVLQKLNQGLISKNNQLNKENLHIIKENQELKISLKKSQKNEWNKEFSQFVELLNQNRQLKKILNDEQIQNEAIHQIQPHKLRKKDVQTEQIKIKYQTKINSLQQQLNDISANMKKLKQSKEDDDHRNSLLMKRWNEIFIRMNPYFDIYKYTDLNLDERQWIFFDQNKDYKTLKQYQNKVYISQKKISDLQYKLKETQTKHSIQIATKSAVIQSLQTQNKSLQQELQRLSSFNNLLAERARQLQEQAQVYQSRNKKNHKRVHLSSQNQNNQDQNQSQESSSNKNSQSLSSQNSQEQQKISQINLYPNKLTIDLLKQLIEKQQNQKNELVNILKYRDTTIIQLHTELYQSLQSMNIEVLSPKYNNLNSLNSKIQIHQSLSNTILQTVTSGQVKIIQNIKSQELKVQELRQKYQNQMKSLQNYYQNKIQEISSCTYKWQHNYQDIYCELALLKIQITCQKNQPDQQDKICKDKQFNADIEVVHQQRIHSSNMINQIQGYQCQDFIQENNPKIIGDGTVHHLATTLKNYENQNHKTLQTITKIREQFQQMKQTVKKVQQLINKNNQLISQLTIKTEQNQRLSKQNLELQGVILSLEAKLKLKQSQIRQIFQSVSANQINQLLKNNEQLILHNEKIAVQLMQLKQTLLDKKQQVIGQSRQINLKSDNVNVMSNDQYELIFSLHSKKNKEHLNQMEKNKKLKEKVKDLQKAVQILQKNGNAVQNSLTNVQIEEYKKIKEIFTNQNVLQTLKSANDTIIKKSKECQDLKQKLSQERLNHRRIDVYEEQQQVKMDY